MWKMSLAGLVAACVTAMRGAVRIPVTVKCRIGIDDQDSETDFQNFIFRLMFRSVGNYLH